MGSRLRPCSIVALALLSACAPQGELDLTGDLSPIPIAEEGKEDGAGRGSIPIDADVRDTEVWAVRNQWEEHDTQEARAAGIAWPTDSGLDWDQKYAAWVGSMQKTDAIYGDGDQTFAITTPWGRTLPAPSLECAEVAIFLRATFAAWYGLPFFMEARDSTGERVFVGHFGARTQAGRWGSSPRFSKYLDYTETWTGEGPWPTDPTLRSQGLVNTPGEIADLQPMLAPDARFGAYADEIFLNKRAGYLVVYLLNFFYSGNLADPVNTYNLQPEAIREGDVLILRWQRKGIGHTLPVKHVTRNPQGQLVAELVEGGMPRHQPLWTDEVEGKSQLTLRTGGGEGQTGDQPPIPYWRLGGGIKRWRVARPIGRSWVNTFMPNDQASWINSTDGVHLSARPKQFDQILGEVPPDQKRDSLLKTIEELRRNLSMNPSSCTSRASRERAFESLFALAGELGTTEEAMQQQYLRLEDFVFIELDYTDSKTCCWNSSSNGMYQVIMAYAEEEQARAAQLRVCAEPTVFAAERFVPEGYAGVIDGYQRWRHWADQHGLGGLWVDRKGDPAVWSEDEECDQRGVAEDFVFFAWADFCDLATLSQDPTPSG